MIFNVIFWRCNHYPFRYPISSYNPNLLYHDDEIHSYPAGCSSLEVMHHGKWYFFDPNMEPRISMAQRAHSNWKGYNDSLKPFYDAAIHPNLSYQFGNGQMAHFGPVNEVPARNARLYRLDKQYSPISAIASLYYLFDTIGIYHCKIYKILAYYINHIGIISGGHRFFIKMPLVFTGNCCVFKKEKTLHVCRKARE